MHWCSQALHKSLTKQGNNSDLGYESMPSEEEILEMKHDTIDAGAQVSASTACKSACNQLQIHRSCMKRLRKHVQVAGPTFPIPPLSSLPIPLPGHLLFGGGAIHR